MTDSFEVQTFQCLRLRLPQTLPAALFPKHNCLRCHQPARLDKFYRLCLDCHRFCSDNPKELRLWIFGQRDIDEDAPTQAKPGSAEKIAVMRQRLLAGLELFNEADITEFDWAKIDVDSLYAEPMQREAGKTGVERDGNRYRARPMAGGMKHNLGEFDSEAEAVNVVEWFWIGWLGLESGAGLTVVDAAHAVPPNLKREEIETAREKDAAGSRDGARVRRRERQFKEAAEEETPLFGAALNYA